MEEMKITLKANGLEVLPGASMPGHELSVRILQRDVENLFENAANFIYHIGECDRSEVLCSNRADVFKNALIKLLEERYGYKCVAPKKEVSETSKRIAIAEKYKTYMR
jgi:hypothetical protein